MNLNSILKKFKSFDLVVSLFIMTTGIYILAGYKQLNQISIHLLIRIVFLSIIFLLIKADDSKNTLLQFLRNFYPLLFLGFFYSETDYYNNLLFENFDPFLIRTENLIFGTQLSLEFSNLFSSQWFSEIMHFGYFSYYLMTFGVTLLFYIKAPKQFERVMFIIILSFSLFYIFFIIFPSIGPQFYFTPEQRFVPKGYLFQKIMDIVISIGETQTGAFPSSHAGMAVIFIILTIKQFKRTLFLLIPLVIILLFSTVYIKAHYAIDTIAGILTGILFYNLSGKIYFKFFESLDK